MAKISKLSQKLIFYWISPKEHVVAEVEEETGYKVSVDRLELVKCYVGAVGIAGVHSRVYYVEVTNQDVSDKKQ